MTHTDAKIALIQAGIKKFNDVVFSAPSFTEHKNYIVTCIDGVAQSCQCDWYKDGGWTRILKDGTSHKCSHAIAVERYVAEEERQAAVKVAEQIVSQPVTVEVKEVRRGILGRLTVAEEQIAIRRGYLTRPVGVRRDPERGIILR